MRTVIFDLDGTLADTTGDLIAAANGCFRDMGLGDVLDPVQDRALSLLGARVMLRRGLERLDRYDADVVARYYPVFLETYGEAIDVQTYLYPGAIEAVEALKSAGYGVGVCTNKTAPLAELLLVRLGIRDMFASVVGAGMLEARKPDPEPLREAARRAGGDPAQCVLIGDSDTDRDTARNAGVPCVLVTFGPSGEDMAALQPEALLDHFDDLPALVPQLIG